MRYTNRRLPLPFNTYIAYGRETDAVHVTVTSFFYNTVWSGLIMLTNPRLGSVVTNLFHFHDRCPSTRQLLMLMTLAVIE